GILEVAEDDALAVGEVQRDPRVPWREDGDDRHEDEANEERRVDAPRPPGSGGRPRAPFHEGLKGLAVAEETRVILDARDRRPRNERPSGDVEALVRDNARPGE